MFLAIQVVERYAVLSRDRFPTPPHARVNKARRVASRNAVVLGALQAGPNATRDESRTGRVTRHRELGLCAATRCASGETPGLAGRGASSMGLVA